ncbi:MAG: PT domain-containing protein [Pseudomonadota bacterium]
MPSLKLQYPPLSTFVISSEKGPRISPTTNIPTVHEGIDFAIADGTNLYNAHDGTVIFSGTSVGYGNTIVIQDKISGESTLYAHLSAIFFHKSDPITGKTPIGTTGNSGTSAYHLHFEVLSKEISDNLASSSSGKIPKSGRLNPRSYIAASPFASMLSTEVHSKELGFGTREGDSRSNTMVRDNVGTYYGTQMVFDGKEGYDTYKLKLSYTGQRIVKNTKDTHIVQSQDAISDADLDGKIIIDTGSQNILLSGNALPKTGVLGEIIAGEWTLDGLNLLQDGDDLVATKLGVKLADFKGITNPKVPTIPIKNFPFSNSRGGFGITLGKKADLSLGEDVFSLTLTDSYLPQGAFAVASSDKGLFGSLAMLDSQGSELPVSHSIGVFDNFGNQLATHDVETVVKSSVDAEMLTPEIGVGIRIGAGYSSGGYVVFPIAESGYIAGGSLQSRVGALLTDASGNVLAANIYDNTNSQTQNKVARNGAILVGKDDPSKLYFSYSLENIGRDVGTMVYQIDPTSLEPIGDVVSYSAYTWSRDSGALYQSPYSLSTQPDRYHFKLTNGATVDIGNDGKTITSRMTKLRDLFPDEIIPNYDLASGSQSTNSELAQQILTLGDATILDVVENPNSVVAVLNLDPTTNPNSKVTFSAFDSSQVAAYATDSSQYSIDALLSGEAKTSDMQLVYGAARTRRLTDGVEDVTDPYYYSYGSNATYSDYYYGSNYGNYTDDSVADDDELPALISYPYTFLELPNNQTVVLVGVNGTELAQSPYSFFLTSENITHAPSSYPSGQPTPNPFAISRAEPTSQPSNQPTVPPSIQPSTQPTGEPSSQPTYLPTVGEIISTSPTSLPSSAQPTGQPSIQPSTQPTGEPSSQPTYLPTVGEIISTSPTSLPSSAQPTGQPSIQPSRKPFAHPSTIPSYKPAAIPSFKPTRPSVQPTTEASAQLNSNPSAQPSSRPTNNPSLDPTHHPIAGDLSVSPTSQPSVNPSSQPSQKPSRNLRTASPTSSSPVSDKPISIYPTAIPTVMGTGFPTINSTFNQSLPQFPNQIPTHNQNSNFMESPGGIAVAATAALLLTVVGLKWVFRKGEPKVSPEKAYASQVEQSNGIGLGKG